MKEITAVSLLEHTVNGTEHIDPNDVTRATHSSGAMMLCVRDEAEKVVLRGTDLVAALRMRWTLHDRLVRESTTTPRRWLCVSGCANDLLRHSAATTHSRPLRAARAHSTHAQRLTRDHSTHAQPLTGRALNPVPHECVGAGAARPCKLHGSHAVQHRQPLEGCVEAGEWETGNNGGVGAAEKIAALRQTS